MNNTEIKLTPRGDIEFIFAEKDCLFSPTLEKISALEKPYSSLWHLVEKIEQNHLACHELVEIYMILLKDFSEEKILAEILQKGVAHYMLVVLQICVPILTGLSAMGAVAEGKTSPQCSGL